MHAIDAISMFVESVIPEFIPDEETDQDTARNTDSQTKDIDDAIYALLLQIAPGDFQVVGEHMIIVNGYWLIGS
jgi:hypothetical protein